MYSECKNMLCVILIIMGGGGVDSPATSQVYNV